MGKRTFFVRASAIAILGAAIVAGYVTHGFTGAFLFPLGVVGLLIDVIITWFIVDCVITFSRHKKRVNQIQSRVSRLSTAQLQEICGTPSHPDFGFAFATLARRGISYRPTRESLLAMLVSPEPSVRGKGMSFLAALYPEVRLPLGSSSKDPPDIWRERVAAIINAQ